jgi:hypothetical protein
MQFRDGAGRRQPLQTNREMFRLAYRGRPSARGVGLLTKVLAALVGIGVVVGAIAVSIVLLAVAALALAVFGGYLWWKTRAVRREMRELLRQSETRPGTAWQDPLDRAIIEGEVIREPRSNRNGPPH